MAFKTGPLCLMHGQQPLTLQALPGGWARAHRHLPWGQTSRKTLGTLQPMAKRAITVRYPTLRRDILGATVPITMVRGLEVRLGNGVCNQAGWNPPLPGHLSPSLPTLPSSTLRWCRGERSISSLRANPHQKVCSLSRLDTPQAAAPYPGKSSLLPSTVTAVVNQLQFPQSCVSFNSRTILFCCVSISTSALTGIAWSGEHHVLTDKAMPLKSTPFIFSLGKIIIRWLLCFLNGR